MVIGTPVVLNLIPGGVNKVVHVNQVNDNIEIQFQIMNGSLPYNVTEGVSCTIRGTKGDSYGYTAEAVTTVGSNVVTVTLTEQLTAVAGGCNVFELVFVGAENSMKVSTENFILAVERAALGEDTVISDSDLAYAEQVLDQLQSVGAVNAQVQQNKANIAAEIARATAAEQTLQQNINAEAAARHAADNTLQSNINAEASTRAAADQNMQAQISQIVAPSGEAPSAAEVQNARVGADGVTYPTLGDAIRANDSQLKSALTTGLSGERTLYFTKLDDGVWAPGRIVGSTGEISTSLNVNIYRRDYFDVTYHKITSPIACLSAFLYSPLGEYIGAWKQTTHSVVKATSGFSVVDSLDFDEIRRYYPDSMILVQSKSETIGDDTSYANQNFTVEYQKTVTIKKIQEGIYETVPLNIADWFPAVISPTEGTTSWSATEITTLDYIPDAWSKIKTYEKSFRIAAYDSTGAYQGWFNYKLGLTKTTSGSYLFDFDIDFLRALYPGYKFKITMYSVLTSGAYADISALGTITINRAAMYASIENEICYKVPTRFTREALYTESRAESGNNCSVQGLCTDGTYLYVAALAVNGVDWEGSVTLLRKIDLQGNLIASGEANIGHANDLAYDPNNNIILAVGSMGNDSMTMHKIDPDTLAVVGTFSFATLFALVESRYGITGTGVHCLAYYAPENVFVLSIDTRHYIIVDATFTNVLKVFSVPDIGTSLGQFLYIPNDDMLFRAYAVNNGKADPVEVYDWHGNKILGFSYPVGHRSAYSELEGICIIDGVWYSSWNISENAIRIAKGVPVGWEKVPAAKCLKGFNYNF